MKGSKLIMLFAAAAAALTSLVGCFAFSVNMSYSNADKYSPGNREFSEEIREIDLNWSSGEVSVIRYDKPTVSVSESNTDDLSEDKRVHTWLDGKVLRIQFCKSGKISFGNDKKELLLKLPKDLKLDKLSYNGSSADAVFDGIEAGDFSADSSSGKLDLRGCTAREFVLDASSGNIILDQKGTSERIEATASSGDIDLRIESVEHLEAETSSGKIEIEAETAREMSFDSSSGKKVIDVENPGTVRSESSSGNTDMTFADMPESIDIKASSGDVTLRLPGDAGFKAVIDTSSGDFVSEIPTSKDGSTYTAGSGSSSISADTSSGNVTIKAN